MLAATLAWLWVYSLLVIEAAVVALAVKLAFDSPQLASATFLRLERTLGRVGSRRTASIAIIAVTAFLVRGVLFPVEPIPEPAIHDEFSYLLAADTFASGRLANPTHPLWTHFESMQIEHQPTYASMYPPAQGLILALGQRLGNPFFGVWIMDAIMCGAICWMLQGWLPPAWALLGAFIAVIRLGSFSYWVDSYMLGAAPATGGALVLGALPRLLRSACVLDALLLGTGVAVLLNSRPYEGTVLSAAAVLMMLYRFIRKRTSGRVVLLKVVVPLAAVMIPTLGCMAYYNWRVFGSPFTLPYQVNRAAYASAGVFVWESPKPARVLTHQAMSDFYGGWELRNFERARTLGGFLERTLEKLTAAWQFYLGPVLTIPLLFLPAVFRDQRVRPLLIACAALALALSVQAWFMPHYAAPIAGTVLALSMQSLRHLGFWSWRGEPVGRALVRMVPVVCVLMLGVRIVIGICHLPVNLGWPNTWATVWTVPLGREKIVSELQSMPGRHLVVVRYGPHHDPFREFVFNAADIDRARIVWARDMGPDRNRELLDYFKDRTAWQLNGDDDPPKLCPLKVN